MYENISELGLEAEKLKALMNVYSDMYSDFEMMQDKERFRESTFVYAAMLDSIEKLSEGIERLEREAKSKNI